MRVSLQEAIAKMLKYRFLRKSEAGPPVATSAKVFFKIVSAQSLVTKENRPRDTYCFIEHGDLDRIKRDKKRKVFQTEVCPGSLDPIWNQHLKLETTNVADKIKVEVWDKTRDHFLGQCILNMTDIISASARSGLSSKWYPLQPRESKYKDKYVGGQIYIEASIEDDTNKNSDKKTFEQLQSNMAAVGVENRSLLQTLMGACITLDLYTPNNGHGELLSNEAIAMLKTWIRFWNISEASQVVTYFSVLFQKHKLDKVPVTEVLKTFHVLFANIKTKGWLPSIEVNLN